MFALQLGLRASLLLFRLNDLCANQTQGRSFWPTSKEPLRLSRRCTPSTTRARDFQKFTEELTDRAGRPNFMVWLMVAVAGWIALNLAMVGLGHRPQDEPPFTRLELAVSLAALFMTVLILRRSVATTNWPVTARN